ncbi:MAG: alpha/beta hydrolase [Pseudoruegeria sp.]
MVDGIPVHAVVRGQGPDVILIHGASGNARDFTFDLVDRLDDHYRVIAFDRPGLGYTGRVTQAVNDPNGPRPETPSEQAILLEAAARQLNVDKAVVLGQSYGGAVALGWAIERPDTVSALVLVSAVTTPWNTDLEGWYALMEHNIGPSFVAPMVSAFATPERADSVLNDIFSPQHPPQGYRNYVGVGLTTRLNSLISNANQVNALHDYITDIQSRLPEISIPVEAIHGTADKIVPSIVHADHLEDRLHMLNMTLLEGVGHMPHHTNPDAVLDAISRAVDRSRLR